MSIVLRDAVPGDEATLFALLCGLADYQNLRHEVKATSEMLGEALFGATPRAEAMLAEQDGAAVGFALWFYSFSTFTGVPTLYVEDVFVVPEQRGGGVGYKLFVELARRALVAGCARMDWSVLDWNATAIAFYRRIGAKPVAGWTTQRLEGDAFRALAG